MMTLNEMKDYDQLMENLSDECLSIHTHNQFCDVDGMHIWCFQSCLSQLVFDENNNCDDKIIASFDQGIIIPSEATFCNEFEHIPFTSAWDLCDSISGDLLAVYETLFEPDVGIKDEILRELDINDDAQFMSDVMYIPEVTYENIDDLKKFLKYMFLIKEGGCAHYCQVATAILNWDSENEAIKAFLEDKWKLKDYDKNTVIVYKKI